MERFEIVEPQSTMSENRWFLLGRNCLVEFIGDLIFVFIGSLSGSGGGTSTVLPALAHGLTIFLLVASMGHLSGGHFNPAVSWGVFVSGNIHPLDTVLYIVSQLLGGFVGSLFVKAAAQGSLQYELISGLTLPQEGASFWHPFVIEAVFTYILVSSVLNAAVDSGGNTPLAPLAIGMSVSVDILAGGNLSGASMNPARSLGPAIGYTIFGSKSASFAWRLHYVYWVGPFVGSTIAALIYRSFLAEKSKRLIHRRTPAHAKELNVQVVRSNNAVFDVQPSSYNNPVGPVQAEDQDEKF